MSLENKLLNIKKSMSSTTIINCVHFKSYAGSPAERNDCDEILEINGNPLEDLAHQEIIDYIHEVYIYK